MQAPHLQYQRMVLGYRHPTMSLTLLSPGTINFQICQVSHMMFLSERKRICCLYLKLPFCGWLQDPTDPTRKPIIVFGNTNNASPCQPVASQDVWAVNIAGQSVLATHIETLHATPCSNDRAGVRPVVARVCCIQLVRLKIQAALGWNRPLIAAGLAQLASSSQNVLLAFDYKSIYPHRAKLCTLGSELDDAACCGSHWHKSEIDIK